VGGAVQLCPLGTAATDWPFAARYTLLFSPKKLKKDQNLKLKF
jgi:hypothetical protein